MYCIISIISIDDGSWYNDNCGIRRGFVCQKPVGGTVPPHLSTTVAVPGFCPTDFFGSGTKQNSVHII